MRGMRKMSCQQIWQADSPGVSVIPSYIIFALFHGRFGLSARVRGNHLAAVVQWLSPNKMGIRGILKALELAAIMAIQIIVGCACAGGSSGYFG